MKNFFLIIVFFSISPILFADTVIQNAHKKFPVEASTPTPPTLENVDKNLQAVKTQSGLPVLFPTIIPTNPNEQDYYVSSEAFQKEGTQFYRLDVDKTADCHSAKYCNIGSVMAEVGKRPEIYASPGGPDLTQFVELVGKQQGYYTPGHAEADFWPPMIVWRVNRVLYTIAWKLGDDKNSRKVMMDLANSAIIAGAR